MVIVWAINSVCHNAFYFPIKTPHLITVGTDTTFDTCAKAIWCSFCRGH